MLHHEYEMTSMLQMCMNCMQASYFLNSAPEQIEYAKNRYLNETDRLYQVSHQQLMASPCGSLSSRGLFILCQHCRPTVWMSDIARAPF